ncbi:MAG TPA: hypothetical protein VGJ33_16250 [Candidatus Angelobacter sp.]|jgi:hypothetical protein
MKTLGYIALAFIGLQFFKSGSPASSVSPAPGAINAANTAAAQAAAQGLTPVFTQDKAQVFVDASGDLVTINSTGGETSLPDPNGIGGGFVT